MPRCRDLAIFMLTAATTTTALTTLPLAHACGVNIIIISMTPNYSSLRWNRSTRWPVLYILYMQVMFHNELYILYMQVMFHNEALPPYCPYTVTVLVCATCHMYYIVTYVHSLAITQTYFLQHRMYCITGCVPVMQYIRCCMK